MKSFMRLLLSSVIGVFFLLALLLSIRQPSKIVERFTSLLPNSSVHNLTPIHSNQWYSSVYRGFPSQPLYAFPLAFRLTPQGLGFSYPDVTSAPNSIHAPYVEDFSVGLDTSFSSQKIESISDWSIRASLEDQSGNSIASTLGHGIPFTTVTASRKSLMFSFPQPFLIYPDNQETPLSDSNIPSRSFVATTRNHTYLIILPQGTSATRTSQRITTDSNKVFIALLSDRTLYDAFSALAFTEVSETKMDFVIDGSTITTSYTLRTDTDMMPLITLLPHHADHLTSNPERLGTYASIRGPLILIRSDTFTTRLPLTIPRNDFPPLLNPPASFLSQLDTDTQKLLSSPVPESRNYFLGTYLGKVITLIQLNEAHKKADNGQFLRDHLKTVLRENLSYFEYDESKTSLVAKQSEFGNDELNDHHFHYGYYIRAAAVLAADDPEFLNVVKPTIDFMVNDIATTDRNSSRFPFLRNFDIYEGHSWASGFAEFADGNNQESTSEALNAWYGLLLWSDATENTRLRNYALYLFTTELESAKYYWFDKNGVYSPPYEHRIASIVWGGKVDFATWFSNDANMIYGIQLLPFTPASFYLGSIVDFSEYEADFLESGGNYLSSWGELMLMWRSFSDRTVYRTFSQRTDNFQENTLPSMYTYFLLHNTQ